MENGQELSVRSLKVRGILNQFDRNLDGCLNRNELANFVIGVNPRVKFNKEQVEAILDEVCRTYSEFIDGNRGLSFEGLLFTYDDGAGDVDRDFDALGLQLPVPVITEISVSSVAKFKDLVLLLVPDADGRQANTTLSTLKLSLTHGELVLDCMTDLARLVKSNTTLTHVEVSQDWQYVLLAGLDSERRMVIQSMIQERMVVESKLRVELERMLNNELRRNTSLQSLRVGSWELLRVGNGPEWRMTYEGPCLVHEFGECNANSYNLIVKLR